MWLFYRFLIGLITVLLRLCSPFMGAKRAKQVALLKKRLSPDPLEREANCWIHGVSLGEAKLACALIDTWSEEARASLLLTAGTETGVAFFKDRVPAAQVRFLPLDRPSLYRKLFHGFSVPDLVIVETELWPSLFRFVHRAGARICVVNGRMGEKTLRLKRWSLFRKTVQLVDLCCVRGEVDRDRFLAFGISPDRVRVSGNMKFDFKERALNDGPLKVWLKASGQDCPLLIFASISTDEVPLLRDALDELYDDTDANFLWVPRHLDELSQHLALLDDFEPELRSQMKEDSDARFLILDTTGELAGCYRFGVLAVVGGSFNQRGGQNFLEALQAGTPALVGPHTRNFKDEVAEALKEDALTVVSAPGNLASDMIGLLRDSKRMLALSRNGKKFLEKHRGAVARNRKLLLDLGVFTETREEP